MGMPSGSHSATKKGDNGTVDPKASGQTTAATDGSFGPNPTGGDNSRIARSSTAGK